MDINDVEFVKDNVYRFKEYNSRNAHLCTYLNNKQNIYIYLEDQ